MQKITTVLSISLRNTLIKVGYLRMGSKDFNDQNAKVFPRVGLEPTSLLLTSTARGTCALIM